jgi:hypothetical protein
MASWRNQAMSQACAFSSPFFVSISEIGMLHQLSDRPSLQRERPGRSEKVEVWYALLVVRRLDEWFIDWMCAHPFLLLCVLLVILCVVEW